MKLRGLLCVPVLLGLGMLAGCSSGNNGSSSAGFLYVATQGDSLLTSYNVNTTSGALSTNGTAATLPGGVVPQPTAMVFSPDNSTLFVLDTANSQIDSVSVGSDGKVANAGNPEGTGLVTPVALAINPSGTFLFAANPGDPVNVGSIAVFSVSGTTVTPVGTVPSLGNGPSALAAVSTPSAGDVLYVANQTDGTVTSYSVGSDGTLLPQATYAVGLSPSGLGVARTGNFLYVTNAGSNNVSAFSICMQASNQCPAGDGSLVPVSGSPFSAGIRPISVVAAPDQDFLYVLDAQSNQVSSYSVSTATGALTLLTTGATASTGANPTSMVIQPFGQFLYVANNGGSSLSAYQIGHPKGVLIPLTNVTPITTGGEPLSLAAK